jgi:hypothetical protein
LIGRTSRKSKHPGLSASQCVTMERASASASEEESGDAADRPNRWKGTASTWRALTEQERGLAGSLDQLRNRDLSFHLYTAHALKKRADQYNALKSQKAQKSRRNDLPEPDVEEPDEEGQGWAPPQNWTAWPLPPHLVPREGELVGPSDGDESYTFKKKEPIRPSRALEEALMGVTLKLAKERFEARRENAVDDDASDGMEASILQDMEQEDQEAGSGERQIKKGSQPPDPTALKPVVSADEDRSRTLLRPTIRHTLSKLDEALTNLHYARETCHHYGQYAQSEATTDDDTKSQASSTSRRSSVRSRSRSRSTGRKKGRPKKFAPLPSRPKDSGSNLQEVDDETEFLRLKTTKRGRPKKSYPRLEGETALEYQVRIARRQKKPMPSFAQPSRSQSPEATSSTDGTPKKPQPKRATSEERAQARQKKLRPRDWSDVLGAAALAGFPPDAIARATQRCANLFGESMTMRTMVEAPFDDKEADIDTLYQPEEIPDLPSDYSDEEAATRPSSRASDEYRNPRGNVRNNVLCPIEGCRREKKGFKKESDLRRHLQKGHRMTDSEIEDALDSDAEMDGAVHVDGFLKPLKNLRFRGREGMQKGKKRMRSASRADEHDEEPEVEEEEAWSSEDA